MKHTPGPWSRNIKPAKKYTTVFSGRNKHVAYIATTSVGDEEAEANINLIAAAPDLLAALKAFVEPWSKGGDCWGAKLTYDVFDNARKAIAKAESK